MDRVEDVTKVTVYSNQPTVELFANGVSLGKQTCPEHFFYFEVPNKDTTNLVAVAGDCRDESVIRKVAEFNEDYRLKEQGAILNWFDITEVEGHLSLNDTLGTIMSTLRGKLLLGAAMMKMMPKKGAKVAGGFELSDGMLQMMNSFTITRMVNMAGGMMGIEIKKEDLLKLNAKLNKIKRPRK